jgi:hypothetical protein
MTKPAGQDVVVKVKHESAASDRAPAPQSWPAAPVAAPRPLPGLARAPVVGAADDPAEQQAHAVADSVVVRLRRQAERHVPVPAGHGGPAASSARPARTLQELHRRAAQAPAAAGAAHQVLRRQVVTQLKLGGEAADLIADVAIVGRPPNTFGASMGDHTTAFTVHVNAVQHALKDAPLAEAAARMGVLVSELRSLPGYALVGVSLPERHLRLWQAALATLTDVRRRLDAGKGDPVALVQQYVGAYLELRELVPLSTVNTGIVSKATSGKGKGEAVEALREQAGGAPQKPDALAAEILGLFDVRAAALACAETDPGQLARLAPGLPATWGARERGHAIVLQHLRSIQTGYPGALAALAGESAAAASSGSGDSPAELAARQRAAAQAADDKVLGRLIDEILSNHVMPRMVTAVLTELERLQASEATDVAALAYFDVSFGDRALDSGKTGKKADIVKAGIAERLASIRARRKQLELLLGSEPTSGPKSSGGAMAKVKDEATGDSMKDAPASEVEPEAEAGGMEDTPEPEQEPEEDNEPLPSKRSKRKRSAKVDPLERGAERDAKQRHELAIAKVSQQASKRARVGSSSASAKGIWGGSGDLAASPVFSGSDLLPDAEPEVAAPAAKARQTVQVVLDDEANVAEVRAAGRPPSPYPGGTMGAHTTAWTVHLDRVRSLLVGKSVAAALTAVTGALRAERLASAEAMGEVFEFKHKLPALTPVSPGPPGLTRLQDEIVSHLEQVNLIPGATLPSADTGGKSEGRHRRVLLNFGDYGKKDVAAAIEGLIDVAAVIDKTATAELIVGDDAVQVLVEQHLASIEAAYPGARRAAGFAGDAAVAQIAKRLSKRDALEKSKKPSGPASAAEQDGDDEDDAGGLGESSPPEATSLALDDKLFGAHIPRAEPGELPGRPESAPAPLLGSAGALVLPSVADQARAALWLDPEGDLIADRLAEFTAAYSTDINDRGTYLAEGEGSVAAGHFGVSVRVYRDAIPPGFAVIHNLGGGDCLLYALQHVAQAAAGLLPTPLSGPQITAARAAIVAGLPPDALQTAVQAIVTDAVAQRHIAGLGTRMRALLNNPGLRHAAAWVRTARQRASAEEALKSKAEGLKSKSEPSKPPPPPAKKDPPPPVLGPPVVRHQAVYGGGEPLADQALLHTGGNHYVALVRRPG